MRWSSRSADRARRALLALASVGAALTAAPVASDAQGNGEARDHALRRIRALERERAYPFDRVPAGALNSARAEMEARFGTAARGAVRNATRLASTGWTSIGPANIDARDAGRVTALVIHPTNRQIIYAGGAQGGVWKTTNGGQSWTALGDRECSLAVGSIALDPVNPDIVYVGTGEQNGSQDSYYGCGVLRSTNGGLTWTRLGESEFTTQNCNNSFSCNTRIGRIVVSPVNAGGLSTTLLTASGRGISKSRDAGSTWTRTFTGNASSLVMHPTNPSILYMAVDNGGTHAADGIYKSENGGDSWAKLDVAFTAGAIQGRIELTIAPSQPSVIYAAVEDEAEGTLMGVWRTTDAGATWSMRSGASSAICTQQCWYNLVMIVDPANADRLYLGGLFVNRSNDGGATFSTIGFGLHVDQHAFAFDPGDPTVLFAGNDGGVYRAANVTTTNSPSWATLNSNIAVTQFYPGIALHPTNPLNILGGTQDNGTLEFLGSPSWTQTPCCGDGGFGAFNPLDPSIAWSESQWGSPSFSGPRRRASPGGSFTRRAAGIDTNDDAEFIPPLVMDQQVPRILYFGTTKLYRTVNDGTLWSSILGTVGRASDATTTAIGVAPSDTSTIYVGTSDATVMVSTDFGQTWNQRISGLPNRVIKDFAIDPTNPQTAYVVVSGFGTGHVFRTTNAGVSWTNASGTTGTLGALPNVPVNAIVIVPPNDVFIGTDLGVFHTVNAGQSWVPFNEGFPNVAVFDLAFNATTKLLVAATHGRGMFSASMLDPVLRGDVNTDGKITAADAQLVLAAMVSRPLPTGVSATQRGDANCNGILETVDAQIILTHVVGGTVPPTACVGLVR